MKLVHYEMQNPVIIGGDRVSTLVIENRNFFRNFVSDINKQINGESGQIVVSEGETILNLAKWADLTDSYLSFTLNRKPLINRITSALEAVAVSGDYYPDTAEILSQTERYVSKLTEGFSCNIACGKITAGSLLKAAGLYIVEDYASPLEQIFDYMELVREFLGDRLFIFINMRAWFCDEDMREFFETVIAHEYKILLIDGFSAALLENENRLTVDDDLCEF